MKIHAVSFKILIIATTLFSGVNGHAVDKCSLGFNRISESELSQQDVLEFQDYVHERMLNRSTRLEKSMTEKPRVYDTVVIGAGLHASIFMATAAKQGRASSTLVVEATDVISTVFGKMDGMFRINSAEQANTFYGSPIQQRDLTTQRFATSLDLGVLGSIAAYSSNVPILFNNPVRSVQDLKWSGQPGQGRYKIETSNGIVIYADKVVAAVGLGEISFPFKDEATRGLCQHWLKQNYARPNEFQKIMTPDTLLSMLKNNVVNAKEQKQKFSLANETKGKTIAVVGSGDGGKITVEALMNKSPIPGSRNARSKIFADDVKVEWLGQSAKTPAEYRKSTWKRYFGIAEDIGQRVNTHSGHVSSIQELPNGQIELTYAEGNKVVADYVVLATGYKNLMPTLMKNLNGSAVDPASVQLEPLKRDGTAIGAQVKVVGGPSQDIFVIGPAAGAIKTKEELAASLTGNPVSVENLGPGSAAMVEVTKTKLSKSSELQISQSDFKMMLPEPPSNKWFSQKGVDELSLLVKMELHRSLLGLSSVKELKLSLSSRNGLGLLTVTGLTHESANLVVQRILRNKDLVQSLGRLADKNKQLNIEVPVSNGTFEVERASLEVN